MPLEKETPQTDNLLLVLEVSLTVVQAFPYLLNSPCHTSPEHAHTDSITQECHWEPCSVDIGPLTKAIFFTLSLCNIYKEEERRFTLLSVSASCCRTIARIIEGSKVSRLSADILALSALSCWLTSA